MFIKQHRLKIRILILVLFCFSLLTPILIADIGFSQPSAQQLVTEARSLYGNQNYQAAIDVWQKVASIFEQSEDSLNQAMALSNLSLTYQQLGKWKQAQEAIAQSLAILNGQETSTQRDTILASSIEIQGKLQLAIGQEDSALDSLQTATKIYTELGDDVAVRRSQINQAKVMQNLGLYPLACQTITAAISLDVRDCEVTSDALAKWLDDSDLPKNSFALLNLGNILRVMGQNEQSQQVLLTAAQLSKTDKTNLAGIYLALGNTSSFLARENAYFITENDRRGIATVDYREIVADYWQDAEKYYNRGIAEAIASKDRSLTILLAKTNLLNLLIQNQRQIPSSLIADIQSLLKTLPPSSSKVNASVNFARSLLKLEEKGIPTPEVLEIVQNAIAEAETLGGKRNIAFALATLGNYYERQQQWQLAETTTEEALSFASGYNFQDIAAELFWQLGRIEQGQNRRDDAIDSYTRAYELFQSQRSDLIASSSNTQFAFRDFIEPVYRELVELLLARNVEPSQAELTQARQVIESLQLAELDNFFSEACIRANPVQIDKIAPNTAVIYSILLKERLEVIISLPDGTLLHQSNTTERPIESVISEIRRQVAIENYPNLASRSSAIEAVKIEEANPSRGIQLIRNRDSSESDRVNTSSRQLYDWLIAPFCPRLERERIHTLVFVLDGALQNIPMAILKDESEKYLIEKYAIVLTPGMQLLDPQPIPRNKFATLTAGLSERSPNFPDFSALPNVKREVTSIQENVATKVLLDKSFTERELKNKISNEFFPIVHIASHGNFSSLSEETYILSWDNPIDATELNQILRGKALSNRAIELLVLSACQTALGDERAVLGLAGIAMRGGAKSTLASLWLIDDESTALLMEEFYQALTQNKISKAEALRQAQLTLLHSQKFYDPYFWSAFILVGNWL